MWSPLLVELSLAGAIQSATVALVSSLVIGAGIVVRDLVKIYGVDAESRSMEDNFKIEGHSE